VCECGVCVLVVVALVGIERRRRPTRHEAHKRFKRANDALFGFHAGTKLAH